MEKEKIIDNEWKDENKLNSLINDCINIENHIKDINIIKENIKKFEIIETKIEFGPEENKVNNFLSIIKNFGHIFNIEKVKQLENKKSLPINYNDDQEIQPVFNKVIEPVFYQVSQPVIDQEIQPVIDQQMQPVIHRDFQPVIHQQIQPVFNHQFFPYIQPNIPNENQQKNINN